MERTEELHLIHKQLEFFKMKVRHYCYYYYQGTIIIREFVNMPSLSLSLSLQPFPLVSVSRQLERKGPLGLLQVEQRLFGKPRTKRIQVYVFAFTDYVLITKKKTK